MHKYKKNPYNVNAYLCLSLDQKIQKKKKRKIKSLKQFQVVVEHYNKLSMILQYDVLNKLMKINVFNLLELMFCV